MLEAVGSADTLSSSEILIASEYYGLTGYPSRLAGNDSLVERIATPAVGRSPKPASRSTVAAILKSATEKIEAAIELPEGFVLPTGPEPDPMTQDWLRTPPATGRALSSSELRLVCRAGVESAFDLVCRSQHAGVIQEAMRRWGVLNAGLTEAPSPLAGKRIEPERRNSAHALLAIALWEIVHDGALLDSALAGDPVVLWSGIEPQGFLGRVAVHPRHGVMTSDLDADDFVLLAGEVMDGNDSDGRATDLLLDLIRLGRDIELFDADTLNTVLWALGYGLASIGSWRTLELARTLHKRDPMSGTTVSLLAWSAHVASLHLHDGMAWRLASAAERILDRLPEFDAGRRSGALWRIELVRSGCRVREADRWRDGGYQGKAATALREAKLALRKVDSHAGRFPGSTSLSKLVSGELRRAEIELVDLRIDADRQSEVDMPLSIEAERLRSRLESLTERVTEADENNLDPGDVSIFADRLDLLESAVKDFLDDLPPTPPTD